MLLTGALLLAITVLVHAIGTTRWLQWLLARHVSDSGEVIPDRRIRVLAMTAIVLTVLHLVEVLMWALTYRWVVSDGQLATLEEALYFSAVTFTTLGYGDVTLDSQWRLLSGIEAINGILLIGWSTAFMFAVLQKTWGKMIGEKLHRGRTDD